MITVTFQCGHQKQASGSEEQLVCSCGESRIAQVDAPAPRFVGHARGPHAEYKPLEAIPVTFAKKEEKANG